MLRVLTIVSVILACALLIKVLVAIVYEYRWYFPPNFDALFLEGRETSFVGGYRLAFYTHIICGPLTVVIGAYLLISGTRFNPAKRTCLAWHRAMGWLQFFLVVGLLVPSGLLMAPYAFAGAIAAAGFACLSFATAFCAIMAVKFARQIPQQGMTVHRQWASRCLIMLCSAIWLRIVGGLAASWEFDCELVYRLNAWLSWLLPLCVYEVVVRFRK